MFVESLKTMGNWLKVRIYSRSFLDPPIMTSEPVCNYKVHIQSCRIGLDAEKQRKICQSW
jgi:hypothetical protein